MADELLTSEQLAEIENSSTAHLPELGDVIAQYSDEKERLLAHARALQAERDAEYERADINFTSYERVKGFYSDAANQLREVERERDEQRLIYAHMVDSGKVQQLVGNAIEAFRQRVVEAVSEGAEYSDGDGWRDLDQRGIQVLIERIKSLPATTNEVGR